MAFRIAWLTAVIPILAAAGAYLIALHQGFDAACIPMLEGCTSISRAARYGDAIFWFRGLMMPLSVLLVFYWMFHARWLDQWAGKQHLHKVIVILGTISALALIIYVNFLGTDGDVYRFMRRFGVTFYFGLAGLAQLLCIKAIYAHRGRLSRMSQWLVTWQLMCVSAQWLLGLMSLGSDLLEPSLKYRFENIIEWNFALAMMLFHGLSAGIWRNDKVPGTTQ